MDAFVHHGSIANPMIAAAVAVTSVERNQSNPIEAFFDSLSNELVVEILLRLPVKSALRCKCVSKRWFSLISDPYFVHQYMHRQPNSSRAMSTLLPQSIYSPRDGHDPGVEVYSFSEEQLFESRGFSFRFLQEQLPTRSIHTLASCNDLVLCSDGFLDQSQYYICNPLTMQWVALPLPHFPRTVIVGLISEQCNDQVLVLTNTNTRCRVVQIPKFSGPSTKFYVYIFCSETWQWSGLYLSRPPDYAWTFTGTVVCNGMLHWLSCESNRRQVINGIVAYNPYNNSTGQCHFIDLPKATNSFVDDTTFFGVCQGHLRLSHMSRENNDLSIWELKDFFTVEWCLQHKVALDQVVVEDAMSTSYYNFLSSLLYFDPSNGDVVYLKKCHQIFLFEMKSKKLKKLVSFHDKTMNYIRSQIMAIPFELLWRPTPIPMLQSNALQC